MFGIVYMAALFHDLMKPPPSFGQTTIGKRDEAFPPIIARHMITSAMINNDSAFLQTSKRDLWPGNLGQADLILEQLI